MNVCPICETGATPAGGSSLGEKTFDCPNCGRFSVPHDNLALEGIRQLRPDALERRVLSHRVRQMSLGRDCPALTADIINRVREDPSLPNPAEQADNIILYLGQRQESPGLFAIEAVESWRSVMGASDNSSAHFVIGSLECDNLLERQIGDHRSSLRLSFKGWQRFEALKRARTQSRRAFMAMPFKDPELDSAFKECFKPAAKQAGFDLFRLDEVPTAGLIDDRMRVAIQTSRFLVAELKNSNAGAYWEAGFAEGLRRPVIYTCEKEFFEEEGTHFDTRNRQTVVWSINDPGAAADQLKATRGFRISCG